MDSVHEVSSCGYAHPCLGLEYNELCMRFGMNFLLPQKCVRCHRRNLRYTHFPLATFVMLDFWYPMPCWTTLELQHHTLYSHGDALHQGWHACMNGFDEFGRLLPTCIEGCYYGAHFNFIPKQRKLLRASPENLKCNCHHLTYLHTNIFCQLE